MTAARQGAAAVPGLLETSSRLADLLAGETGLLRAGRIGEIAPLQEEKLRLSRLYGDAIKELEARCADGTLSVATLRQELAAPSHRLAEAVAENERALRIGRAATRRLLDMVVQSVQAQQRPLGYNARLAPGRRAPLLTLALDRRL